MAGRSTTGPRTTRSIPRCGCGAIAIDDYSGLWYWGTGIFQDFAESDAIEACLSDGGGNCYIEVWACNS